jgi:hypothetical protein
MLQDLIDEVENLLDPMLVASVPSVLLTARCGGPRS